MYHRIYRENLTSGVFKTTGNLNGQNELNEVDSCVRLKCSSRYPFLFSCGLRPSGFKVFCFMIQKF